MDGWKLSGQERVLQFVCWSPGGTLSLGGVVIFLLYSFQVIYLDFVHFFSEWILTKRQEKRYCGFYSAQRLWLKAVRFPGRAEGNSLEAKDPGSHWNLVPISRRLPVMSLVTSQEVIRRKLKEYKAGIIEDGWEKNIKNNNLTTAGLIPRICNAERLGDTWQ